MQSSHRLPAPPVGLLCRKWFHPHKENTTLIIFDPPRVNTPQSSGPLIGAKDVRSRKVPEKVPLQQSVSNNKSGQS